MIMTNILFASKKRTLLILGVPAVLLSFALFHSFNDPEGPNLLVIAVGAAIIYGVSLTAYALGSQATDAKRFGIAILVQILVVFILYFLGTRF